MCYGSEFWFGTKCIGFPVNCTITRMETWNKTCVEPSCSLIIEKLYENNKLLSQQLKDNEGTDVILVIDTSNSMEGAKLLAAKQAAQALVGNLQNNERIAVVIFSEDAWIEHNFSDDKRSLTESIMGITLHGGTNYLPGLIKADDLFTNQKRAAKKGIIFLSDGLPSDNYAAILNQTKKMENENIAIFAISFDIDTIDEKNILKKMVSEKNDSEVIKKRYREYTNSESLTEGFYEAWQEISNMNIISITPSFEERVVYVNDMSDKGFWVMLDNLFISDKNEKEFLCAPQTRVVAHLTNEEDVTEQFVLISEGDKFLFKDKDLVPGKYNLTVSASLIANHNGSCVFSGKEKFGSLTIVDYEKACNVASCEQTLLMLDNFDLAASSGVSLPRKSSYGRVAVLVDSSQSMQSSLPAVVHSVERLNVLLSADDKRALMTFDDESKLLVPLTYDTEYFSEGLEKINPQGTTKIIPALVKVDFLFQEDFSGKSIVVILTDGIAHDNEGLPGIEDKLKELVDDGNCLIILGFGSEMLREKEFVQLFREMTTYSAKVNNCGEFVYAPDSDDLSSIITEMFGGEKRTNESLRLVVERTKGSDAGSIVINARVVSMKTGLHIPARSGDVCTAKPEVSIVVEYMGDNIPLYTRKLADGSVSAYSPYLLPGKYHLFVEASLPVEGCSLSQTFEDEFIVIGPPANTSEGVIILIIIFLSVSMVVLSWKMWHQKKK